MEYRSISDNSGSLVMSGICGLIALFIILFSATAMLSCKNGSKDVYKIPDGFEDFAECEAHYRVFAECTDSVHQFNIKALMTAFIDTDTTTGRMSANTTYILTHVSGGKVVIETNDQLLGASEFRNFVNSHHGRYNDTIIPISNKYDITGFTRYNLSYLDLPFAFMDVSFKGYPSLLVRRTNGACKYYDVFWVHPLFQLVG